MQDIVVKVFSKVPDSPTSSPSFYWYREGTKLEKERGQHIVVDDILSEQQLESRLNRNDYGNKYKPR